MIIMNGILALRPNGKEGLTLWYVVTLCLGTIIGFIICAFVTANSHYEDMQQAYNYGVAIGIEEGKKIATEKNKV